MRKVPAVIATTASIATYVVVTKMFIPFAAVFITVYAVSGGFKKKGYGEIK